MSESPAAALALTGASCGMSNIKRLGDYAGQPAPKQPAQKAPEGKVCCFLPPRAGWLIVRPRCGSQDHSDDEEDKGPDTVRRA